MIFRLLIAPVLLALSLSVLAPPISAIAAEDTLDSYRIKSGVGAGIYLRIPFIGGLRRSPVNGSLQYGLKMGYTWDFRATSSFHSNLQHIDIDMLTLKFGTMGFENLSVAGNDMLKYSTTTLGARESKVNWTNLGIGVIVAGVTAGVAVLASTSNDAPPPN